MPCLLDEEDILTFPSSLSQAIQSRKEGLVSDILVTRRTLGSIGLPEEGLADLHIRDLLKLSTAVTAYVGGSSYLSASKFTPNLKSSALRASPISFSQKTTKKKTDSKRQPWKRLPDRLPTVYDDVTEYVDAGTQFAASRYGSVDNPRFGELKESNEAARRRAASSVSTNCKR